MLVSHQIFDINPTLLVIIQFVMFSSNVRFNIFEEEIEDQIMDVWGLPAGLQCKNLSISCMR